MKLERHDIIDRYFRGEMSAAEEKDFLDRVASDPELDGMLRAEQLIRSAVTHERDAAPTAHPQSYARFLTTLADNVVVTPVSGGAGGAGWGMILLSGLGLLLTLFSAFIFQDRFGREMPGRPEPVAIETVRPGGDSVRVERETAVVDSSVDRRDDSMPVVKREGRVSERVGRDTPAVKRERRVFTNDSVKINVGIETEKGGE